MPVTISNTTGDGLYTVYEDYDIEIPDSGGTVLIAGSVQIPGNAPVALVGSPITLPAPPASGVIYALVQANLVTGALTVKQSTIAVPTPDPANGAVYSVTIAPSNTNLALDPNASTPDTV